jgi:hypothetical protein
MAFNRVPVTSLPLPNYADGQILFGADVNIVIDVFKTAINANGQDIATILSGDREANVATTFSALSLISNPEVGDQALVLNDENEDGQTSLYSFDGDDWVIVYQISIKQMKDQLDALVSGATTAAFAAATRTSAGVNVSSAAEIRDGIDDATAALDQAITNDNRLNVIEPKFNPTTLANNIELFNQPVKTDSTVQFKSVAIVDPADTINPSVTITKAKLAQLDDTYKTAASDNRFINLNQKGAINGVATLDSTGRMPVGQLPLNTVVFRGTFGDGVGDLPTVGVETGDFYICVSNGFVSAVAGKTFDTGDKAVYDGTGWSKIDNTETVTSVNGAIGAVVLDFEDVGAAPLVHTHVETDITDLDKYTQAEVNQLLGDKSDVGHTHLESDITDLDKYTQQEVDDLLDDKSDVGHTHVEADITDLDKYTQTEVDNALALKLNTSLKGAVNGLAELDANGHVPANQLPSFVDDVLEYASFANFPTTGQSGKIYVAQDTGLVYRWGVTMYIEIAANEVNSVNGEVGVVVLDAGDIGVNATGFTKILNTDDVNVQLALAELDQHTHVESDIINLDKYTQAQVDALLAEKANVADLSASITLYPTTTPSAVSGYFTMVTDITDTRYNDVAFNVGTGAITSQNQLIASLATDASIFTGNPGVINVTTIGNIRKTAGNSNQYAEFFYRIFQRKADGTEIQIGISETTGVVNPINTNYFEFSAAAVLNNGTFETTDRFVIKYYANALNGSTVSQYDFQFGGATPVRTLLPVPVRVLQSAERILYNNDLSSLQAENLQDAVDELEDLIFQNTTVIQIQKFNIIAADNGSGGFTYTYAEGPASVTGTKLSGAFVFPLRDSVVYIPNNNRVEAKVNNDITFYYKDSELIEIDQATLAIDYAIQDGDEVFFKIYQGLDSVALVVADGSITTQKLSTPLQGKITSYDNHIASTLNPHGVTKTQVGLSNVTNDAQVKKAASSTDGFVPKWNGTTGDAIVDGYGVQTTLSSTTTDLVRADAIATAIGTKQDTLVSGTNIKTLNGATLLGSGNYEIDIPAVTVSNTAPAANNVGDLWWNSTNGVLYIYYNDGSSAQWVEVSYVDIQAAIAELIGTAPEILDTLGEISDALGDDANFATNVYNELGTKANKLATIETISANYTLVINDAGKIKEATNTNPITITVPLETTVGFAVGTQIAVLRNGAGTVTFAGASGVTVNSVDAKLAIKGQYSSAALLKTATNTWQLVGSLE